MNLPQKGRTHFRVLAVITCFVVVIGLWGSLFIITNETTNNCSKIHNLYLSIDRILENNSIRIVKAVENGSITPDQGAQSLKFNQMSRETLKKGDCVE